MPTKHEWERSSWTRPADGTALRQHALRAWLIEQTEGLADDAAVPFTLAELREVLTVSKPSPGTRGARLRDKGRGVVYNVTIDPTLGSVGLRTVEIVTKGTDDRAVFRVPVAELIREAAAVQAFEAAHADDDSRPAIVIGAKGGSPTPETLLTLIRGGVSRAEIATRYERSVGRVDQWLREARDERPDLDWPETRRGPRRTQTTGGKRPSGSKGRTNP